MFIHLCATSITLPFEWMNVHVLILASVIWSICRTALDLEFLPHPINVRFVNVTMLTFSNVNPAAILSHVIVVLLLFESIKYYPHM